MNARQARGLVNTNNVLDYVDNSESFGILLDELQYILDDESLDLPNEGPSGENIKKLLKLIAYFATQRSYFLGLWGVLRYNAGTNKVRIAARDYTEACYTTSKDKYEATSRMLTAYQSLREEK